MKPLHLLRPLIFSLLLAPALACAEPSGKQRIFNDDNYRPRGAYNSLPPPPAGSDRRPSTAGKQASSKAVKVNWSWSSHAFSNQRKNKKPASKGVFHYRVVNNRIDTSSVCNNYNTGSLIYRDCRKAAKKHFNDQCSSSFAAACVAAGMTP